MKAQLVLSALACATLAACGNDDATARLAFAESPANALTYAPTNFKMKLIAAYLTEDIDRSPGGLGSNIGVTSRFYEHPACAGDLMHCDISPGAGEDGRPIDHIVDTYFDFSPGADVNGALNAQSNPVEATTYRFVRLEFCKYNAGGANNVQWGGSFDGDTVTNAEFRSNACGADSAELVPPLTVTAGDTAVVTLSYSLADAVSDTGQGANCATVNQSTYCFNLPTFTPAARLE